MKFSYKRYSRDTLRPVVPIKLINGTDSINYEVLVDSGADLCIFNSEIGEAIGIDIQRGKAQEVFGVGGKASVFYLHPVTIDVGGWQYKIEAGFMPSVGNKIMKHGLVGQKGFFEHFIVKFDLKKEEIEIKNR